MNELKWSEYEVTECLGVLPKFDEDSAFYDFEVAKNGLTLKLGICPYRSLVEVNLYQTESSVAVFETSFFVRGAVKHINEPKVSFLEFSDCVIAPITFDLDTSERIIPDKDVVFEVHVYPNLQLKLL